MTAVRRLLTMFLLSLTAATLLAQTTAARKTEQVTAETDQDVTSASAMRLSLADAIQTALNQNLGVQLQNYETRIASQNLRSQYGIFDWISAADLNTSSSESPTSSTFLASGERRTSANITVLLVPSIKLTTPNGSVT